jgi:hypothetical protein
MPDDRGAAAVDLQQQELYRRLVFVVGNARSGTTIVAQILNMSESVFVLEEGALFLNLATPEFPRLFNARQRAQGKPLRKGTYVPPFDGEQETGLATLQRLARDFAFVGDKVAFTPAKLEGGTSPQQRFFEEHAKYFLGCRYIFIARNPHESLLSMHRVMPTETLGALLWGWLESLRFLCIFTCWFPQWRLLFLEQIGEGAFAAIGHFLGLELSAPDAFFDARLRQTSLSAAYDFGREKQDEIGTSLGAADIIYQDFQKFFSPTTLRYQGNEPIFGLMESVIRCIEAVQTALQSAP